MKRVKKVPLTWLQAFEAAGRTGSFKAAAEELSVSPSNISHQVRDLEAWLGTLLFSRQGGRITLTQEGKAYLPGLTAGFSSIREASDQARPEFERLRIGTFPFLSNELLVPRMDALEALLPGCDISLHSLTDKEALIHSDASRRLDVIVRYGKKGGRMPGLAAEHVADVALVPIVGPDVPADTLDDFLSLPMARVIGPFPGWDRWAEAFAPGSQPQPRLQTDSFHAAMLAISRNEAAGLGVQPFINPWLDQGRVRALSQWCLHLDDQAAFAVYAPYQALNQNLQKFIVWLRAELARATV